MVATSVLLIKNYPTKLNRLLSLLLILILGFLIGLLAFSTIDKVPSALERVDWSTEARWIGAPQPTYRFYARHDFDLAAPTQSAWLRVSADNDFILYINGQAIAREKDVLYNAWGLSSRLSEKFQKLESVSYRTYGYDWLHLANARDWKITTYADLAPYLKVGKNTIALEVQKGRPNPRMAIEGYVHSVPNAPPIDLTTGVALWQISTLYETDRDIPWFDPNFTHLDWSDAVVVGSVREKTYSRVSSHLFDRPLQGMWIAGDESAQGEVQLQGEWETEGGRGRAYVRFAGSSEYLLSIDGLLVRRFADRQLHMYDITNFLHPGRNIVTVRLARPLARSDGSPLEFFLDGWMELKGSIVAPFATSDKWYALLPSDLGVEQRRAAIAIRPPIPLELRRKFEGNAYWLNYPNYLWRAGLWCIGSTGLALLGAWLLGSCQRQYYRNWWHNLSVGTGLLLPGILFLIGIGLLKHRYAESERGIIFAQSQSNSLIWLGFLGVVAVTLLWSHKRSDRDWNLLGKLLLAGFGAIVATALVPSISSLLPIVAIACSILFLLPQALPKIHWNYTEKVQAVWQNQWLLVAAIALLGLILRVYNLGFWDCEADENTSLDAIRGILKTGAPQATSGIWYTRSPAYHYAVALWLRLIGESVVNARLFSALWGTATLVLVFIFTRKFTPIWIALFITALLAIDPFEIYFSRFLRFYQMVQFTSLLSFWLFFKGFVFREGKLYQHGFFIALTLTVLSQEVTITLIPCFLLGFLCFYRPFRFVDDWHLIVSSLVSSIAISFNIIFFSIKCLTPVVAISNSTDSYLRLHLFNITGLVNNFFINNSRLNVIYTSFFFLGFAYFLKQRDGKLVFLFSSVLLNLVVLTLLIYQIATRYAYQVYPIFIISSIYSGTIVIENLGRYYEKILNRLLPLRNVAIVLLILLFISNIEPERVLAAYQDSINRRNDRVFQYIRDRRQLGDVVLSPSPPGAAIYLGGLDYFLPGTIAFDVPYWHEGRVIDRWAGGVMVTNLDRLSQILEKANRVWIHMDDHAERKFSREFLQYLQVLGKPEFETFGARLRLWRKEDGVLPRVPNEGGDLGSY
ncbi:glycosyl transferase [Cyanosarcina cf. burmensis CCALA 770]|nr:glycosyl transferase [Cyanosarcina cf. burmensis CCALA 770]